MREHSHDGESHAHHGGWAHAHFHADGGTQGGPRFYCGCPVRGFSPDPLPRDLDTCAAQEAKRTQFAWPSV